MRLLAVALALANLMSAVSGGSVQVGTIDPNGKITHSDKDPMPRGVQYMACAPKEGSKCGDKALTTGQCLQSCHAKKSFAPYLGDVTLINCDAWSGCNADAMSKTCACDVGQWLPDKYPGKNPPTKDVQQVAEADKLG